MALESRYRDIFSSTVRKEGDILFGQFAVSIYQGGSQQFSCEVKDSGELFDINFICVNKSVDMICDCEGIKNKPCGHLWAAILTADKMDVFKDGYKRGVRLSQTAAAESQSSKPAVIKESSEKIIKRVATSFFEEKVERELLYILDGSASKHYDYLTMNLFWRPIGQNGPIKSFDPFSSSNGFSVTDKKSLLELSKHNISSSGNFKLIVNSDSMNSLIELQKREKLFTKKHSSQKQFKKIRVVSSGEAEFTSSLDEDCRYNLFLSFSGLSLQNLVFLGEEHFISESTLFYAKKKNLKSLIDHIFSKGPVVEAWDLENFMQTVLLPSGLETTGLASRMNCERVVGEPQGNLFIRTALFKFRDKEQLHADLSFNYAGKRILENDEDQDVLDFYNSRILTRDRESEQRLKETLKELAFRFNQSSHKEEFGWKLSPANLPETVEKLLRQDWIVVAEGKTYVAPKTFQMSLVPGTDWFDLKGELEFENEVVPVAGLVQASKEGSHFVQLGDGSFGVLPEEWLKYYTVLTQLGEVVGDDLRFRKSQALIIEKLLAEKLEGDPGFQALSKSLENPATLMPAVCHPDFKGTLRPYQQEGLSWLQFLAKTGFNGILADDMGLGKTVQVLAMLQGIKASAKNPTLLIVPRSLIFNWQSEIIKFTNLSSLVYTGPSRGSKMALFNEADIVISTYGTIRQDIELIANVKFNYCILDEAQAIKNRDSSTAKAIRLINSRFKLSMSGTPLENSLSDLISQFEFLNPGMTAGGRLESLLDGTDKLGKNTLKIIKEAFKPFILRRTKKEVAKDLPEKIEQIIYCDMDSAQKEIYEQMRDWYRQELSKEVKPEAGQKKGVEFLGALTRLRQLACHPGLVNEDWLNSEAVKVTVLISRLKELISEGHRVLIFSQFTSFLNIIRERVIDEKWQHCYLDGKTRDRKAEVENFQNNQQIPLFLISLKAGGVGLNLTGADYVFLMDPWWNPAIENQAVDRAYRIGQKKQVMACRLVCRGTVEEKVLSMQRNKQDLADSLIDDDDFMGKLSMDDIRGLIL